MIHSKNSRRKNPIRTFLKRSKKTLAQQVTGILEIRDDLTAREIGTLLYDFTILAEPQDKPTVLIRQYITNITKDFNHTLGLKLLKYDIERYYVEDLKVFKYRKKTEVFS